jgi:hypothetical protein
MMHRSAVLVLLDNGVYLSSCVRLYSQEKLPLRWELEEHKLGNFLSNDDPPLNDHCGRETSGPIDSDAMAASSETGPLSAMI